MGPCLLVPQEENRSRPKQNILNEFLVDEVRDFNGNKFVGLIVNAAGHRRVNIT
jgi:hypothetical protein